MVTCAIHGALEPDDYDDDDDDDDDDCHSAASLKHISKELVSYIVRKELEMVSSLVGYNLNIHHKIHIVYLLSQYIAHG